MRNKMKRLIIFVLLTIPLFGQIKTEVPNGYFWSDSLWNGIWVDTVGVDDTTAAHASAILDVGFNYDWMTITCIDTGETFDDSVRVYIGTIIYTPASGGTSQKPAKSDTLWNVASFLRDSTWTNLNTLVDDASQHTYTVFVGDARLVKVSLDNLTLTKDRVFWFYATLSKKK
jgi:hypothetical protein